MKFFLCDIHNYTISAVSAIVGDPPSVQLIAGTILELSAVPISEMPEAEEEPSSVFQMAYPSASEQTMGSFTPSSFTPSTSYASMHTFNGKMFSIGSNHNRMTDAASLRQLQLKPSESSVLFSHPKTGMASGIPPGKNYSSSVEIPDYGELHNTENDTLHAS